MEDIRRIRQILMAKAAGLVATMCAYMIFIMRRARQRTPAISYGPLMERDKIRQTNLRFIYDSNDTNCVNQLRMRRAPFFRLCHLLRQRELLRDSIHSSVEEQVAMFLLVVGHNVRFRALQPIFRRSTETISRYFGEVLYAIGELRNDLIKPPSTDIPRKILANRRFNPYFKDCIGAIDGTHVLARVLSAMSAAFRGRKGVTTQNVMAAVDFDLKFIYVLAGWEGSAHDALILADALERDDGFSVPAGKFYLVDAGYATRPGFLPPYHGCRYHFREYEGSHYPRDERELFNLRHSSLRVTIERAFGAFKNHFKIIYNKPFHPYKTQVKLVLACCILHNWILSYGNDEYVPLEEDWNLSDDEEEELEELEEDNRGMVQIRDELAGDMWATRGSSRV